MIDPITKYILNEQATPSTAKLGRWSVRVHFFKHLDNGKVCEKINPRIIINGIHKNMENIYNYVVNKSYKIYKDIKKNKAVDKEQYKRSVVPYKLIIRPDCSTEILFGGKLIGHSLEVELTKTFKPIRMGVEGWVII